MKCRGALPGVCQGGGRKRKRKEKKGLKQDYPVWWDTNFPVRIGKGQRFTANQYGNITCN